MDPNETLDLFNLWNHPISEQTTSASAGGFVHPLPGPLRRADVVGKPSAPRGPTPPTHGGYEDVWDVLGRTKH